MPEIETHNNILTEEERIDMINFIKTKLKPFSDTHPGLQTDSNLHEYPEMQNFLKKISSHTENFKISHCWANSTNGDNIAWHSHPNFIVRSIVYYLKNKCELGTIFKKGEIKVEVTKAPENSLAIFDSRLEHSVPMHLPEERISVTVDLIGN
tara:strand:+ start:69 stop:524 length:456 start_codon:yes stop_codon:yes gene_type:complete